MRVSMRFAMAWLVAGTLVACGGGDSGLPDAVGHPDAPDETGQPDLGMPDAGGPDGTDPDDGEPDDLNPDGLEPDAPEPDGIDDDAMDPDGIEPDAAQPDGIEDDGVTADPGTEEVTSPDAMDPDAGGVDTWEAGAFDPENCALTPGSLWVRLEADLLVPDGLVRDGVLLIDDSGLIACVGADCSSHPENSDATVVSCKQALITPALINGHDHIGFTGNTPKAHGTERYDHRHEWRKGLNGHTKISVPTTFGAEAWGELRNVLAGTTSMFGSGNAKGLLRNLDRELIGLQTETSYYDTFPLKDSDGEMLVDSCAYPSIPTTQTTAARHCYVPHVAEGVNAAARNEFLCLAGLAPGGQDNVLDNTAFIHGVALLASDIAEMANDGTGLIWSPRTNVDLYGNTASIVLYDRLGVTIGLGTDWTASGSVNMMRELACADELNRVLFGAHFTDRDLFDMATIGNARAFKVDAIVGSLEVGKVADVAIFHSMVHPDLRAVFDGHVGDVALVLRGGTPLYGDAHLVPGLPGGATGCEELDACGVAKRVCTIRETGKTLDQLRPASAYDLFFCGIPDNEPSCIPFRPGEYDGTPTGGDADGDGIPDSLDNCPALFNPVRPVDNGVQGDADGDAVGDLCDPCPLDADTTDCTTFDPDDRDADGIPNVLDNCPAAANPDQEDSDDDGKGDACDPCPFKYNPGSAYCPEAIYDVKSGVVSTGASIRVVDARVTAIGQRNGVYQGFFVQVAEDDPAYAGPDYSGLYCYGPSVNPRPEVGSSVTVDGTVGDYFGQIQLSLRSLEVTAPPGDGPTPVVVAPADVATGGTRAAALEGVVVRILDVTALDVTPAAGPGDSAPINEFVVTGGLRVNDFVHLLNPFPLVGDEFASITGVLRWANEHSKLEPRSEFDAVRRNILPRLAAFEPALAFLRVGELAVPIPGLKARLLRPVDADVFVMVESSDPLVAAVPDGGVWILAGAIEADVPVDGLARAESVLLTATLDDVSLETELRVVDPAVDTPVPVAATPDPLEITLGDTAPVTVHLDVPVFDPAGLDLAVTADPAGIVSVPATVTVGLFEPEVLFSVEALAVGTTVLSIQANGGLATLEIHVAEAPGFPRVFISEYVEGSSYNKAVEVFNNTGTDLLLSTCELRLYSNGSPTPSQSVVLSESSETIPPGGTFVACHPQAHADILAVCGLKSIAVVNFNGDDAIDLICDGEVVDVFGQIGTDPGSAWIGSRGTSTADRTLRRTCGVTQGDPDGSDPFDPDLEFDGFPKDTLDGLGIHAIACP